MDTKLIQFSVLFAWGVSSAIAVDGPGDMPDDRSAPDGPPPAPVVGDGVPGEKIRIGEKPRRPAQPIIGEKPGAVSSAPDKANEQAFTPVITRKMRGNVRLEWITSMRDKLPMAKRDFGPFGLSQNPNEKVEVKKAKSVASAAFLNAIKAMEINFVNATDGRFAVGSREFRQGEIFPIQRGNQRFTTEIVTVKSSYIIFKDVNSGEHVKRNLEVLPEGMTKNGKLESIEGIEPRKSNRNQPLKVN